MRLEEEIQSTVKVIEYELSNLFENETGYQKKIFESINYSLFTGGKRLRPILFLKTCEAFNNDYKKFLPFACAIEMIHTYSLIHDDLPSMDDDDFRRGKLTNHKVYGESIAILTGDGLLNLAFETMTDFILKNSKTIEDYKKNIRAMNEISNFSGVFGMIGGQVVDLLSNDIYMDEDKLLFMYKCKTAALIQASVVSGAILGDGLNDDIERMRNFGLYLGLAYQIRDDILDEKKDKEIKKVTYLNFKDVNQAKIDVKNLSQRAIEILDYYEDKDMEFLKLLTKNLIDRSY
ncbi:polyprenyl synthetase family protein [Schnuerera sp. xch1]|uniref:polyprenyl synthetase family protein n=1 Tax=Schnuerera sp. xch1 TaxID=2874283 RepID=UPI001CBEFC67|nr:farnesyl diphosphate synthase [Schnuerera sp. xch1]MBZ2173757.1 polyprenyl synthetase family protein [Schnuerera sp. xch1]